MAFLRLFVIFFAMIAVATCGSSDDRPPTELPTRTITVEGNGRSEKLIVELAITPAERQKGLMLRQALPEDAGMLFLFPADSTGGFWMKDTYVPLSIAYLAADGRILVIREGKPLDTTLLNPGLSYRNVLEVNSGWFERHQLGVGDVVRLPSDLPTPQ